MARRAKKTALTPEERLRAALVPEGEQPYPVSENWCWICGKGIFLPMETKKPSGEFFDYIDIDSIDNSMQCVRTPKRMKTATAPSRASRGLSNGDTVFSLVRPYLKNIAYIDETLEDCIASTGFYICRPISSINSRYMYWLMTSSYVVDGLNQFMKGDNSPSIRSGDIERFPFPLAPLPEQQRIVARIESLFAKLDEAKEKVQAALDSFEPRKAAVLHRAFSGELTEGWRKKHGIGKETWVRVSLIDILVEKPRNGYSPSPVSYQTETKSMTLSAVTSGVFMSEYYKYIDADIPADSYLWLEPGGILIQRANSLDKVGSSALYTGGHHEFIYPDLMMKLRLKENIVNEFVAYQLKTDEVMSYIRANATGTAGNMPKINQKTVLHIPIVLPTVDEQTEIVRLLDAFFEQESQAKAQAEAALEAIDTMKKSILAKAFRGGLGTNDPAEESALELLKSTLNSEEDVNCQNQ